MGVLLFRALACVRECAARNNWSPRLLHFVKAINVIWVSATGPAMRGERHPAE